MFNLPLFTRLVIEGNEVIDEPVSATIRKHTTGLVSVDDQTSIVFSLSNEKRTLML